MLPIPLQISCENFFLDQDNNFNLISLSILITCLQDNTGIQILREEVIC